MKEWRLTPRAEKSLTAIARWTIIHFGARQADKYRRKLIERIEAIAAGELPSGRPCSALVPELPDTSGLRCSLIGRHYVIYREIDEELQIIDFVHSARDLDTLLRELSARSK